MARSSSDLESYGQLLRMLLPRSQGLAVYGAGGHALWLANGQDDPDLHRLAVELTTPQPGTPQEIDGYSRVFDGATAYGFRLRDDQGLPLAAVTLLTRENGEPRPFSLLLGLVRPALECLQRELSMRASIGMLSRDLSSRDRDLELLLDAPAEQSGTARNADELGRLVQAAVEHLDCALGALIVPEKSVAAVRARRGAPRGGEADVVTRTHRHLMTFAQLQRRPMVVNKVGAAADRLPPYKILSVPVKHLSNRVIGFLALFNPADGPDFELRHTRLAELLSRKIASILVTSFDATTGLSTRAAFEQQVDSLLQARTAPAPAAVVYVDVDRLHVVNETFGMHVGDEVIVKVAEVVRRRAPVGALSARISGDRYALFLPDADVDAACRVAEELRAGAAALSQTRPDGNLEVSVSCGVAPLPANSKHPLSHALATAEIACKTAKDRGRGRVESFHDGDQSMVRRHHDVHVVARLKEALAADRFRLYAQPILPLAVGPSAPRFEILLRLETESGELLPPAKFLSAAERCRLMPAIDRWVVAKALAQLGAHRSALQNRVARFALNLSGQSVGDPAMADAIEEALRAAAIPADILCFELTETAAVSNLEKAELFMQRLRALGCQFALDDFGTGQSSLAYLKSLPVAVLKIDGSFVRDSATNPRSDSLVRAVAQLARSMGITTVAECVETDDLRMRMGSVGVDYGQGFAIGKPLPLADVLVDLALYEVLAQSGAESGTFDAALLAG
ncbi:MAG: bifunctional diguanylate cyclase/phosphodiesterase [Steroidobacteraceae bacterium]|jgi:diguanylate cyclase (GGDEF)-like protein|nr:bifunctional diguanylate cyclase/phosphodiesterase [Steroidobacteraceae bacterium]